MKKAFFVILTMLGLTMSASAGPTDYCKISGTTDGSSATVSIDDYDSTTKRVTVGFYNDSEHTVTVQAIVTTYGEKTITVVATIQPRSSMSKQASWPHSTAPSDIAIKSAKCQPK